MSFIDSMFSDSQGAGFKGASANIIAPTNAAQTNRALSNANIGLGLQRNFINDLNNQNALNQQKGLLGNANAFYKQLFAQHGAQNQQGVFNQQQDLANQLKQQALGQGPNPALAQLAETTGQNVAQQAALLGSQRGAGANPGLAARSAALAGSGMQQQATGQAATLAAQQELAAQQALQQQLAGMGNLSSQQVGQQQAQQNFLGNLTGQMAGQRAQALGQFQQGSLGEQQALLNALQGLNTNRVAMQSNINNVNAGIAQGNQQGQQGMFGGVLNSAGSALAALAEGGMVDPNGPQSLAGQYLQKFKRGGKVFPISGEQYAAMGKKVPGKASIPGDSLRNDKVPAMLSPGEIIVPRSKAKNPEDAASFVRAVIAKGGLQ